MLFIKYLTFSLFLFNGLTLFSQGLVFTNGKNGFKEGTEIILTLQADRKEAVQWSTKSGKIVLDSFSFDSIVTLKVSGLLIDTYTNQYDPVQFKKLDTIELYQSQRFLEPTPRFFLNMNYDLDSAIHYNAGILRSFMADSPMDSVFVLEIYHTTPLKKADKVKISQVRAAFCKSLGVEEKQVRLMDKRIPYSTVRFDFFNQHTCITQAFIDSQNTPWMREKAAEYRLVLVVDVIWKK